MSFQQLLTVEVYNYLVVFARIGSCIMVLPGLGSGYILPRARLLMAVAICLIITPLVPNIPQMPGSMMGVTIHVFAEIFIGVAMGGIARLLTSAIHVAGSIIAMQASLAQASLFDPNQASQNSVFGTFLDLIMLVLIFSLNLHHVMIVGLIESYDVFEPFSPIPFGDFSQSVVKAVSTSFEIGFMLSAPLIIVGTLVNVASGLLARLMPSFQVFFVIMPAQILIGVFVFMATFSAGMLWYMNVFAEALSNLFK